MAFKNGVWEPENSSVADNVTKLTSSSSPLMESARGMGMKVAARRGLINSSMAARSSEAAAIDAAVPIASQDAANTTSMNQSWLGAETTKRGQEIDRDVTTRGQDIQRDITTRGQDLTAASDAAKLDASKTDTMLGAISKFNDSYSSMFQSIMGNEKMSEAARSNYLTSARNQMEAMKTLASSLTGVQLNWGAPAPAAAAPAAPSLPTRVSRYA